MHDNASVRWSRWFFVLGPALLLAVVSMWAYSNSRWDALGVAELSPNFGDLRLVTATADCVDADPGWNMDSPTCDPYGRAWNYPSVWARSFAVLGLGIDRTEEVGVALVLGFCAACAALSWLVSRPRLHAASAIAGALAVLSPAGWLALERGNTDLLIFVVLTIAIVLAARGHDTAAVPFLAFAGSWKVFPIGGALGVVRGLRQTGLYALLFLLTGGFALLWEFPAIVDRTQRSTGSSYGVTVVPEELLAHLGVHGRAGAFVIGYLFLAAGIALVLRVDGVLRRRGIDGVASTSADVDADAASRTMLLVAAGTFLFSYLTGSNWDYRLIFLVPCVLALGAVVRPIGGILMWGLVAVMFLSRSTSVAEHLDDVMLLVLVPTLGVVWCDVARVPGWRRVRPTTVAVPG